MDSRLSELARAFLMTPPLWTLNQFGLEQFPIPEVDLSLVQAVQVKPNMRLGHKMESVFSALMTGQRTYEIIDQNIIVRRNKKTIGEIDFLLRDLRDDRFLHLELTYKFYLIDTDISEPVYQLVGPNRRDMFFTKLDKIREVQFALPFTPEGSEALKNRNLRPDQLSQQVCFKAQLFQPYRSKAIRIRPLNKGCITGFWLRFEDLQSSEFTGSKYYLPIKEEWVVIPYNKDRWISYFEVLLELNLRMLQEHSTLVWMKRPDGVCEKFFVVWW